jgi:ankyrin repeat protein
VLIENGAGVTAADGNPIHYAGQRKHKEICRLLVSHGAIDDIVDSDDGRVRELFRASYRFDADAVEAILVEHPDLVDYRDVNGRTPLHEACTHGDTKTVRVLMRHGAETTAKDNNKQTPADRAASHRQRAVTKILDKHRPE